MATQRDIADRFANEAGKLHARLLRAQSGNVRVCRYDDRNLVSYGTHFVLARIMPDDSGARSWWLLNGDTYSISTTHHQTIIRAACQRTGLPTLIVPFSCLREARIDRDSITPIDIQAERFGTLAHYAPAWEQVPEPHRPAACALPDGRWTWSTYRHWLGASLFRAGYTISEPSRGHGRTATRTACFLSAFDVQESRPHYFLCELPYGSEPDSVADALDALKPPEVIAADATGLPVTRQGDVFAIPTTLRTRHLPGKQERGAHLLHVSHTATEVCVADDGTAYARGTLRHAPFETWRAPEHRRQRMSEGKTWHVIVKNTVPIDTNGESRAWSRAGHVD